MSISGSVTSPQTLGNSALAEVTSGAPGVLGRSTDAANLDTRNAFRDALAQASQPAGSVGGPAPLKGQELKSAAFEKLKFSSHAVDRMKSRGISFTQDDVKGIENAVQRAAQKGSRDTLVLAGDNALIVSVKNNTVVTVMDRSTMKENVFTNIDSTVVI